MATIIIPTPLRKFTSNQSTVAVAASQVIDAINELIQLHPDLGKHLRNQDNKIQSFVRIYVGDSDYLDLQGNNTPIDDQSVISIVPAIAGGL